MTKDEEGICLAMVLGDGHVRKDRPEFSTSHGLQQKEYVNWKADVLSKITGKEINVHETKANGHPGLRFSVTDPIFNKLREECYEENGKPVIPKESLEKLTPQAIAIWYMDDGSLCAKKRDGKIHAYDLSLSTSCGENSAQNVIDYFKETWDISFTMKRNKGLHSIRCGTKEARKFINIVKPFVLNELEYKTLI